MADLADWDSFYTIVGPSAGALIGLQFVVLTLVAANPPPRAAEAGAVFGTPTIVHFGAVLLLSALLRAPWHSMAIIAALWGVVGLGGAIYVVVVTRAMTRQTTIRTVLEDWVFYAVLPLAAYLALALSPFATTSHPREALFAVGAAVLLLLFVGIHNAWDAIAYHVFVNLGANADRRQDEASKKDAS